MHAKLRADMHVGFKLGFGLVRLLSEPRACQGCWDQVSVAVCAKLNAAQHDACCCMNGQARSTQMQIS